MKSANKAYQNLERYKTIEEYCNQKGISSKSCVRIPEVENIQKLFKSQMSLKQVRDCVYNTDNCRDDFDKFCKRILNFDSKIFKKGKYYYIPKNVAILFITYNTFEEDDGIMILGENRKLKLKTLLNRGESHEISDYYRDKYMIHLYNITSAMYGYPLTHDISVESICNGANNINMIFKKLYEFMQISLDIVTGISRTMVDIRGKLEEVSEKIRKESYDFLSNHLKKYHQGNITTVFSIIADMDALLFNSNTKAEDINNYLSESSKFGVVYNFNSTFIKFREEIEEMVYDYIYSIPTLYSDIFHESFVKFIESNKN